ncbi:MAG: hypothetical protein M3Y09_00455 [Actinomycetota bacterium]|nr:hypothetical protein [Actinomycetota bacterium]
MSDADLARLAGTLGLTTHMQTKPGVGQISPGLVRLDFHSGLFLLRGASEDEWILEGRTWGEPVRSTVHDWHIRAALAARQLDPTVKLPPRQSVAPLDTRTRPVGRAATRRLARLGRRLLELD